MCNKVLWDPELNPISIPEKGVGWKVFCKKENGELEQRFLSMEYKKDEDGWINWGVIPLGYLRTESGFCFFLNKEDAEKMVNIDPENGMAIVRKIEYEQGIQEREQSNILQTDDLWRIAICKRFRIVEEEPSDV